MDICAKMYEVSMKRSKTLQYLVSTASKWWVASSNYMLLIPNTGCNRRNVQDFGRVFLRSNYNDITQNTYIQS